MKKMSILSVALIALFVSFTFVTPASAGGGNNIPEPLAVYLNLSRQQNEDANSILADFYEFSGNKFDRYSQLDWQISSMRSNPMVEPLTIGIHVGNMIAEQVTIERAVKQRAAVTQKSMIGLLNPVQVALLSRLVDAMNLAPIAWSAVSANFLTQPLPSLQTPVPSIGRGVADPVFSSLLEVYKQRGAATTSTE